MKKEKQIGIRVGVPVSFALELEDIYKHTQDAHRALAFPDFLGFLIGLGLEQFKGTESEEPTKKNKEPLHLFDMDPAGLHDLFREYDQAQQEA